MVNCKSVPLVVFLAAAAIAGAQSDAARAIKAFYAREDSLTLKKDAAGLIKLQNEISTADFTATSTAPGGQTVKRTRAEESKLMQQIMPMIDKFTKCSTQVGRVTVGKSTATATVISTIAMKTRVTPQDRKAHTMAETDTSEDTWVKVGGSWKIKSSKSIKDTMTLDGKLVRDH